MDDDMALVRYIANQIHRVDSTCNLKAYILAGKGGMERAAKQFDPDWGLSFRTYAAPRIREAILGRIRRAAQKERDHE